MHHFDAETGASPFQKENTTGFILRPHGATHFSGVASVDVELKNQSNGLYNAPLPRKST
jgi:hypothetical protein